MARLTKDSPRHTVLALLTAPEKHREVIRALTDQHGIGTVVTSTRREFHQQLFSRGFHAVLMDVDHCDVCASLKQRTDVIARVPVVFLSDHDPATVQEHVELTMAAGASGIVFRGRPDDHEAVKRTLTAAICDAKNCSFIAAGGGYVHG